ncbi:MAG: peptidylprolyl isomerase [Alphaproteobacteria bacterium]|nr:peptidylprolyl isomerase [Alphaproteobacteria bacterium]
MSEPITIQDGHVVLFHYVLKDDGGQVLDASDADPMIYLHGYGNIVPGLERQLLGKSVGDELHAVVPPEEAYGVRREGATESVHRSAFPSDMQLEVGMPLRAEGSDGQSMVLWIDKIEGARVHVTSNHPLAGATLHFDVKVVGIRESTPEEVAHGHAHGPHGHGHHH